MTDDSNRADNEIAEPSDNLQKVWENLILASLAHHINKDESELKWLIVGNISENDLTVADHKTFLKALKALDDHERWIDRDLVETWLGQNNAEIAPHTLDNIYSTDPIKEYSRLQDYLDKISNRSIIRETVDVARNFFSDLLEAEKKSDPQAAIDAVTKIHARALDISDGSRLTGELKPAAEMIDPLLQKLENKRSSKGFSGLDCGFTQLNHAIDGFEAGLYIVSGPTSCGKTMFVNQLAHRIAELNKLPVLFYTYEESVHNLLVLNMSRLSTIDSRDIVRGRTDKKKVTRLPGITLEKSIWNMIDEKSREYKKFGKALYLVEAGSNTTIDKIRLHCQAARRKNGFDKAMVVIDHLEAVPPRDPNLYACAGERNDHTRSALRRLAREIGGPVIATSAEYFSSGANARNLGIETIGRSADVAMLLLENEPRTKKLRKQIGSEMPENPTNANDTRRALDVVVIKNRVGPKCFIPFNFTPEYAYFEETPDAEIFIGDDFAKLVQHSPTINK